MSKRILVADDSSSMRLVLGLTLREAGFQVVEATDGRDALEKLGGGPVHLVIADVNMPNLDGVELTQRIRALPPHRFTPILILTTETGEGLKEKGRAAGATGWIVKPFHPEQLVAVVRKVLG
jgi:two-component system chemotaxis response regulator CheY